MYRQLKLGERKTERKSDREIEGERFIFKQDPNNCNVTKFTTTKHHNVDIVRRLPGEAEA